MLKKFTSLTLLVFFVLGFQGTLTAQNEDMIKLLKDPSTVGQLELAFKGQAELTEADVLEFLRLLPKLAKAGNNPKKVQAIMEESSLGQIRYGYASIKIALALGLLLKASGYEDIKTLSAVLQPSKSEIALVSKYQDEAAKLVLQNYNP